MDKLVSIVLPVYNGEKYLAQSIESVLDQTYKNLELIIVNDCSTDSSEEIILKYKSQDERIVYIKNEINSKLPKSLNNGFAIANGEYFTWTSDDNMYHQNAIETMVEFMEQHADVGLVYCDYNIINSGGEIQKTITVGNPEEHIYKNVVGACFIYRRLVTDKVGEYDTSFFLVEDYEYWLRINLNFRISPLNKCLYDYRWHEDSLTLTKSNEINQAVARLHWTYLPKYEQHNMPKIELFTYFSYILRYCSSNKERIKVTLKFAYKHKDYFVFLLCRKFINRRK